MGWKGPNNNGKKGNGDDPWGKDGPPDLDEAMKQLQRKIAGLFGGGRSRFNFDKKGSGSSMSRGLIAVVVFGVYLLSGIYIVQPYEEAVIKRFGHYVRTEGAGPHWIPWFIETRNVVNVDEVKTTQHGGPMLTKDENIVSVEIAVQYRIKNSRDYLFNLVDPDLTIRKVAESSVRSVVGQSTLNEVLTSGRADVTLKIRKQIEQVLNSYNSGLEISDLAMQQTKAPEEVKESFDDAIKAQQDEERFVNEAEAYAKQRIPFAEGKSKRILQEAQAYKEQQILIAKGDTARFEKLLPEYKRQPQIMRDRMYLDTLEEVYSKTSKVILDTNGNGNMTILPLDQIMKSSRQLPVLMQGEEESKAQAVGTGIATASTSDQRPSRLTYEDVNQNRNSRGT